MNNSCKLILPIQNGLILPSQNLIIPNEQGLILPKPSINALLDFYCTSLPKSALNKLPTCKTR